MLTRLYSPHRSEEGFTLIELLIVVIIIGILAAIALPIFLNQQKAAADASVQSDVRNTADDVQTFLVGNSGTAYATTSAYTTAGGKLAQTTNNTVDVSVGSNGAYTVCGYTSRGARFTSNTAAYEYDSTSGKFTTYTAGCPGDTASPATAVTITTAGTTLPNATSGQPYTGSVTATGTPAPTLTATGLPTGLTMDASGNITGTATTQGNYTVTVKASNGQSADATKTFTMSVVSSAVTTTITWETTSAYRYQYDTSWQNMSQTTARYYAGAAAGISNSQNYALLDTSSLTTSGHTYSMTVYMASPGGAMTVPVIVNGGATTTLNITGSFAQYTVNNIPAGASIQFQNFNIYMDNLVLTPTN